MGKLTVLLAALRDRVLLIIHGRKQWVIHASFQGKIVAYGVGTAALSMGLMFGAIKYFFWRCQMVLIRTGVPFNNPFYDFLAEQERFMAGMYFVIAGVSILIGAIVGVVLSHRVAGPLYRMRKHMLEAASGRAPRPLKFRDKDYFQELAEAYNEELKTRGRLRRPGSEPNRAA